MVAPSSDLTTATARPLFRRSVLWSVLSERGALCGCAFLHSNHPPPLVLCSGDQCCGLSFLREVLCVVAPSSALTTATARPLFRRSVLWSVFSERGALCTQHLCPASCDVRPACLSPSCPSPLTVARPGHCACFVLCLPANRLVGLVVKASAWRAEDPGFESGDFFGIESYQ